VWNLARRGEHRERDRQVEAGSFLSKLGRCEVDDHAAARQLQFRGPNRAPDPLPRFLARAVGQPDDGKSRNAPAKVRFDLHPARLQSDECMRDCTCEHANHGTA